MIDSNKVGELIRTARKKKGLSQNELADMINISREAISKWENGHHLPDLSVIDELADALGISREELLNGELYEKTAAHKTISKKTIILILLITILFAVSFAGIFRKSYTHFDEKSMRIDCEDVYDSNSKVAKGTVYLFYYDESVKLSTVQSKIIKVYEDGTSFDVLVFSASSSIFERKLQHHNDNVYVLEYSIWQQSGRLGYIVYYAGNIGAFTDGMSLDDVRVFVNKRPGSAVFPLM